MKKTILITGAAGYIGSHFVEALIESEALKSPELTQLILLDSLVTGHLEFIDVLSDFAIRHQLPKPIYLAIDLLDEQELERAFLQYRPEVVLHFAALISVAESVQKPELYRKNNVQGSVSLLKAMKASGTKKLVFSSTAAVYGRVEDPILAQHSLSETTPLSPINPYGDSKLKMERAIAQANQEWGLSAVIFRYFNAAGATSSGRLGEWHEPETHLIPLILRSISRGDALSVFGTDYETRDGSCVRDYIHVSDLADAHLRALYALLSEKVNGLKTFNLGTETGSSVLEVIAAAEKVTGKSIQYQIHPRRPGDSGVLVADSRQVRAELGWAPAHSSMENILKTAFQWEQKQCSTS